MRKSLRSVIRSVFEGGGRWDKGGRLDRSRVKDGLDDEDDREDDRDEGVEDCNDPSWEGFRAAVLPVVILNFRFLHN
jgi:hypothetical protein